MKAKSNAIRKAAAIASQFKALLKHFSVRLLNNDMLSYDDRHQEGLIFLFAGLVMGGGLLAAFLMLPYLAAVPGYTLETVWIEKTLFITFSMALTGLFAVLSWDNIFLDKKDYDNLFILPTGKTTIFSAKFTSIMILNGAITVAFNLLPAFIFPLFMGHIRIGFITGGYRLLPSVFSHFFACFMANLFIFLAVSLLQTLLTLIFRGNAVRRASLFVQGLLIFGFISVFIWFPRVHPMLGELKESWDPFMEWFPVLWFVGLSEHLNGNYDYLFWRHARLAVTASVVLLDLYLLGFPVHFRKYSWISAPNRPSEPPVFVRRFTTWLHAGFLRHPEERAVFHFTLATLKRSRYHKLLITFFTAIPASIFIGAFVNGCLRHGFDYYRTPRFASVALPLAIFPALIVGLRAAVSRPASPEAAWFFQSNGAVNSRYFISGAFKALLLGRLLPTALFFLGFQVWLWGLAPALIIASYTSCIALLLFFLLFQNFPFIPFTRPHIPGALNLKATWLPLILAFITYISLTSRLGLFLLANPSGLTWCAAVTAVALFITWRFRLRRSREQQPADHEPESAFLSLGFDPH